MIGILKRFRPIWTWLGTAGVSIAVFLNIANQSITNGSCSGSCGACGIGCAAPIAGVAAAGVMVVLGKRLNYIKKFFLDIKKRFSRN